MTKRQIPVTCPCGTTFTVVKSRHDSGHGRYCSKACMYRYRVRPSGLKYQVLRENPGWFKPGGEPSMTSFQSGHAPWNKGRPTGIVPPNVFKPGETAGAANIRWAGNEVGYRGLHIRVYKERGPAADHPCEHADETCQGPMNWANISHEYRNVEDFMPLCQSHHFRYDGVNS